MSDPTPAERAHIMARGRRLRAEIEVIFTTCDHWNRLHPDEEPVDPDPDGSLRRIAEALDRQFADDTGEGLIPPIGGWLNPLFGRSGDKPC